MSFDQWFLAIVQGGGGAHGYAFMLFLAGLLLVGAAIEAFVIARDGDEPAASAPPRGRWRPVLDLVAIAAFLVALAFLAHAYPDEAGRAAPFLLALLLLFTLVQSFYTGRSPFGTRAEHPWRYRAGLVLIALFLAFTTTDLIRELTRPGS
jgi:hypothetical protein